MYAESVLPRCLVATFLCGLVSAADFVQQIQPVFERWCYSCHGPKLQMGGLRLDSKNLAMAGGQSGAVIKPGNARESSLYQRVAGIGEQARMPMAGEPLKKAEVELIQSWIDGGAVWPESVSAESAEIKKHWAYVAPRRPVLPKVKASHPIDRFIAARLEKEGLSFSPEADKVILLRRLSLDLIGLPPSIAEVNAFLADKSKDAYGKQVERLLQSPHYGERWGRHWLDAARYADSDGFEKDKQRWVWFYRDWVVNALNRDLPYDRFVIEQIAGDLLPGATQDQRVATGFLRNSMINEEGGIDPEQFRMEAMFDRMDAIGKAILGVTIQCAQCHNHKYDPLTQEDYYRMFAFLNNAHESNIAAYTPEEERKRAEIFRQIREIEEDLKHRTPDWPDRMARWEQTAKGNQPEWTVVHPEVEDISTGGQRYLPMGDGSFLAQGYAPTKHRAQFDTKTNLTGIRAFRLDLLTDPNLPMGGPGRSIKGTAALTEFEVEIAPASEPKKREKLKIVRATADFNGVEAPLESIYFDKTDKKRVTGPIEFAVDGKDETAWGTDAGPGRRNQPRKAVFVAEKPVGFAGGTIVTFYLSQKHGGWNSDDNMNHNLGRMRLSVTPAADVAADPLPKAVREGLGTGSAAVFSYWRTTVPEWKDANERIEQLWKEHPAGSSQLVLAQREQMRPTHMLARGDFLKPAREVKPGVPGFLHTLPQGAESNRLGFAKWLVDRNSPTTARAIVNRVWQAYFGTGLVATSEDLGKQAEAPSHPELLDWLAVEFMEKGWSLKNLHRTMATSAAYRQSSNVTPELQAKDPFNRLLARGPRFRVEAEIVRDIALAASGLLNTKVGGPSVYPPAPEFLFQPPVSYGPKQWHEEKGENRYRRGLYTFRYRSVPYPMLQNFDAPNGDMACVRRTRSNTPLQALTTLNEPLFVEAAQALAERTLKEGGATDRERMEYAFRRCVVRKPTGAESDELLSFLSKQQQRLPGKDAWAAAARILLNLDETITKE